MSEEGRAYAAGSGDMSGAINEIAAALAKAQATIRPAAKDGSNPHFTSRYSTLAEVWDTVREALTGNGIAVVQLPRVEDMCVHVVTMLTHSSGQWLRSDVAMPLRPEYSKSGSELKPGVQQVGSAITYGRRYGLCAMAGVASADEDDDGNAAARGGGGSAGGLAGAGVADRTAEVARHAGPSAALSRDDATARLASPAPSGGQAGLTHDSAVGRPVRNPGGHRGDYATSVGRGDEGRGARGEPTEAERKAKLEQMEAEGRVRRLPAGGAKDPKDGKDSNDEKAGASDATAFNSPLYDACTAAGISCDELTADLRAKGILKGTMSIDNLGPQIVDALLDGKDKTSGKRNWDLVVSRIKEHRK